MSTTLKRESIIATLEASPGMTCNELAAAFGRCRDSMATGIAYWLSQGAIFKAGPHRGTRYYASRAEAEGAHGVLVAEAKARTKARRRASTQKYNNLRNERRRIDAQSKAPKIPRIKKWVPRVRDRVVLVQKLKAEILLLAQQPEGFTIVQGWMGRERSYLSNVVQDMKREDGILISVRRGRLPSRYFVHQAHADAYRATMNQPTKGKPNARKAKPLVLAPSKPTKPAKSNPNTLRPDAPVIYREVPVQVLPCRIGERWQVKPQGVIGDWMRL